MKRLAFIAACVASVLCSCEKEKIYTEDELCVIVEWIRGGWSEVYNETQGSVTLITSYFYYDDITSVIDKGECAVLDAGAAVPGKSIPECLKAVIKLDDGTEIICTKGDDKDWSKRFFQNYESRQEYEVVDFHGKKLRHDLIIRTYHIDNELIELWRSEQD